MEDLKGKTVAVPDRFANHRLIIFRELKQAGMEMEDVNWWRCRRPTCRPRCTRTPSMPFPGEPFMGQTEMDGYGRVLFLTKDVWPGFISCVLAVGEETIKTAVPRCSGLWMASRKRQVARYQHGEPHASRPVCG